VTAGNEADLVDRLRAGDEDAFVAIVRRYQPAMVRLASAYVPNRDVAEEVVQEAWLGVVRGIEKFEGRASLKTWLFRIVVNRARTAGAREHRELPADLSAPSIRLARFGSDGGWAEPPAPSTEEVEDRLAADALLPLLRSCLARIPALQAQVVSLRDIDGLSAGEACAVLGITDANQRVLLHRGRCRLRGLLGAQCRP
jgi:RNA polymerase sigma-70 factor (ECF subfamily)